MPVFCNVLHFELNVHVSVALGFLYFILNNADLFSPIVPGEFNEDGVTMFAVD